MKSLSLLFSTTSILILVLSCKKEEPVPKPVADFTFVATANGGMTFTNISTFATSYTWDFGDASNSAEMSPNHNFSQNGTYSVVLTATGAGGTVSITKPVIVSNISIVGTWKMASIAYTGCTNSGNNQAPNNCTSCPSYVYTESTITFKSSSGSIVAEGTYSISGNTLTFVINGGSTIVVTIAVTSTTLTVNYDGSSHGPGCTGVEVDTRL